MNYREGLARQIFVRRRQKLRYLSSYNCDIKLLKISKNVTAISDARCKNVILLVYLHPKNVIHAKTDLWKKHVDTRK